MTSCASRLAYRDRPEGIVGDRRFRPEEDSAVARLGDGERVVGTEVGHARRHESGGDDRLDLGVLPMNGRTAAARRQWPWRREPRVREESDAAHT